MTLGESAIRDLADEALSELASASNLIDDCLQPFLAQHVRKAMTFLQGSLDYKLLSRDERKKLMLKLEASREEGAPF